MKAKTCWAVFHGRGGYPAENMRARSTLELGKRYRVTGGRMSQCSTSLELSGVRGLWNSVMFRVTGKFPIENPYSASDVGAAERRLEGLRQLRAKNKRKLEAF
jgi:hypothetical protein